MKKFKSILLVVPENRPQGILRKATDLAIENRAQLTLTDVVSDKGGYVARNALGITPEEIWSAVLDDRKGRLEELKSQIGRGRVQAKVLFGPAHVEIIREVLRHGHDLVMIEESQRSRHLTRLLLRKCPCPVWVVPEGKPRQARRVLAAVDPVSVDRRKQELNRQVLDAAVMLAKSAGLELHVVHAWTLFGESTMRSAFGVPEGEVTRALRETHKERVRELNRLLSPAGIRSLKPKVHLLKGDAEDVIPALIAEKGFSVLVMGTVCRTGLSGFFMGNTAERILDEVTCSVLALKPSGFVSPVTLPEEELGKAKKRAARV
jgi:universal stress protein E